jgi:hypothetical protein
MMAQHFADRIELSFWNVVIYLLSNSKPAQKIYRTAYGLKRSNTNLMWIPVVVIAWAGIGLLAGFVAGRMGVSLW